LPEDKNVTVLCEIFVDAVFPSQRQRFPKTQADNFFLWLDLKLIKAAMSAQKAHGIKRKWPLAMSANGHSTSKNLRLSQPNFFVVRRRSQSDRCKERYAFADNAFTR
jgi:hypothetical protein